MGRVLLLGTLLVTTLYLLTNLALLQIFGLQALSQSDAIGADLMEIVAGSWAAQGLSLLISLPPSARSTRRSSPEHGCITHWAGTCRDCIGSRRGTAWLDARAGIAGTGGDHLLLILFGALRQSGVQAMVAYRAGILVLHVHDGALAAATAPAGGLGATAIPRALVPWLPLLFASSCLNLFVSSTLYAGPGALLGLLVLAFGLPLLLVRSPAAVSAQPRASSPRLQLELVAVVNTPGSARGMPPGHGRAGNSGTRHRDHRHRAAYRP